MDFEESVRSSKVLQGQENIGFISPLYGCDTVNHRLDFDVHTSAHQSLAPNTMQKAAISEFIRAHPTTYPGFAESSRFPKVLQGQEICPLRTLTGKANFSLGAWGKPNLGCTSFNTYQASKHNFFPLASESLQKMYFSYGDRHKPGQIPAMRTSATNFPGENVKINPYSIQTGVIRTGAGRSNVPNEHKPQESISALPTIGTNLRNSKDDSFTGTATGCKLFGFSLTGEIPTPNSQSSSKRSCTKVSNNSSLNELQFSLFF